jgi:glucan phosphoethanolaminetransferase (alkaline phosphatase superfamily)
MTLTHLIFRRCLKILASVLLGLLVSDYFVYVYVRLYANKIGVSVCSLSEDYGMGMVGMFLQIGIFFLTTTGMLSLWLYRAKRNNSERRI